MTGGPAAGAEAGTGVAACERCGLGPWPAAPGSAIRTTGPLAEVHRAGPGRRWAGTAVDWAPAVLVGAAVGWTMVTGRWTTGWAVLAATVGGLYLLLTSIALATTGRTAGLLALGLRSVDDVTGLPVGVRGLLRAVGPRGRTVTADLRRGRDPLSPVPLEPADSVRPTVVHRAAPPATQHAITQHAISQHAISQHAISIVLDTGERHVIHRSLIIGRLPEVARGGIPLLAWPDLSRRLSRSHALLEWSGSVLWVTDLQSAYGTVLISPAGERRPLVPGVRGAAAAGWQVDCGGRTFRVEPAPPAARDDS